MSAGIELRHLRNFIALAEELHFGRAAARCHVSQPPFSVSIRQLEHHLGFALVERTAGGVRLTPAGAAYYEEANKVLAQVGHAEHVARRVESGLQGVVRVGFFASMLYRRLDAAVQRFAAHNPEVELQLVELSTADQIPALLRKQIHYGFIHGNVLPAGLMAESLTREPFVLCVPQGHAARAEVAELAGFAEESFVLFSRAFSPIYYDQVVSVCLAAGFYPKIRHEARHWLTVLACVARGMGVTLVPHSLTRVNLPGIRFIRIPRHSVESVVSGVWLDENADDPALLAWRSAVHHEIPLRSGPDDGLADRLPRAAPVGL
ncbi:LysR family transcriptional regulator [Bordetella sp. 2513F-2]